MMAIAASLPFNFCRAAVMKMPQIFEFFIFYFNVNFAASSWQLPSRCRMTVVSVP
jgi:hypothetical protein